MSSGNCTLSMKRISILLFVLLLNSGAGFAQGGDNCAAAQASPIILPFAGTGNLCNGAADYSVTPSCIPSPQYTADNDWVYYFTANQTSQVSVNMNNVMPNATLASLSVWSGCPSSGSCLAGNGGSYTVSANITLNFAAISGQSYYILVDCEDPNGTYCYTYNLNVNYISPAVCQPSCTNVDFEANSFTSWYSTSGTVATAPAGNPHPVYTPATTTAPDAQHNIMSGAGNDGFGGFPVVNPDGGNYSVRLGDGPLSGYKGGSLEQLFQVSATNSSFVYSYAVVVQYALDHLPENQPYFKVEVFDEDNNIIPCGQYLVVGGPAIPNFFLANPTGLNIYYRPWTPVYIDLSAYIGQCVLVRFTVGDCGKGGHFCYAYVDCSCEPLEVLGNDSICSGATATLTAPAGALGYSWSPGGETTQSINVSPLVDSEFEVTMTSFAGAGCTTVLKDSVFIFPSPTADFTFNAVGGCAGGTATFTNNSSVGISYLWDFGEPSSGANNTSTLRDPPVHNYSSAGPFDVMLVVSSGGCNDTMIQQVTFPTGGLTASFNVTAACKGDSAVFTNTSTGSTSWSWKFGDGSPLSTDENPKHKYTIAKTYTVTLTASGGGCSVSSTKTVVAYPAPVPNFTSTTVCRGNPTSFTNTSTIPAGYTITTRLWNFGDTTATSGLLNPTHTYAFVGTHNVKLIATSNRGCVDSVTKPVTVNNGPTSMFTDSISNNCTGGTAFFKASTTGASYYWEFDDPASGADNNSTDEQPSHLYAANGVYTITLTVTQSGCASTSSSPISIGSGPITADFTNTTVCLNNATAFTGASLGNPNSWLWNFGEPASGANNTSTLQNPTHTYATAGKFAVKLIARNAGATACGDTLIDSVTVHPLPLANFTFTTVCFGDSTKFTDGSSIVGGSISGWSWNFGDPTSGASNLSTLKNPAHIYTGSGNHTVLLTVTSNRGCQGNISKAVMVNAIPVAAFTSPPACAGFTMPFTDASTGGVTKWSWNFGDPSSGVADTTSVKTPSHTYVNAGAYTVRLIVRSAGGCLDTATQVVTVSPIPVADFTATTVCIGIATDFADNSSVATGFVTGWDWDFGDGGNSILQNPSYTFLLAGTHTVVLTVTSDSGCTDTDTLSVIVYPQPVADFIPTSVCVSTPTIFTDQSSGGPINAWDWDFGDTSPKTSDQSPVHTYALEGNYSAILIVTNTNGCKDTATKTVAVNPLPVAAFSSSDTSGCLPHCVDFTNNSTIGLGNTITQYTWIFGDGSTSGLEDPTHCYGAPGTYDVQLTVTSNKGCTASFLNDQYVVVHPLPVAAVTADPQETSYLTPVINFTDVSTGTVKWIYDFGDDTDPDSAQNPVHTFVSDNKGVMTYTVTQTVENQFGCIDTATVVVIINPEFTFFISNTFTPNKDGINDFYFGKGIGIKEFRMWIFDRWGNQIWDCLTEGLPQETNVCKWDGVVQDAPSGEVAQQDVYVWKVKLTDVFSKTHNYIGTVTIVK